MFDRDYYRQLFERSWPGAAHRIGRPTASLLDSLTPHRRQGGVLFERASDGLQRSGRSIAQGSSRALQQCGTLARAHPLVTAGLVVGAVAAVALILSRRHPVADNTDDSQELPANYQ